MQSSEKRPHVRFILRTCITHPCFSRVNRIREAVTKHSNFSILSSVVQNEELLPEVQDVLKEAKELARRVRGFVVVCETLSGLAQVDLTFYPGTSHSSLPRWPSRPSHLPITRELYLG